MDILQEHEVILSLFVILFSVCIVIITVWKIEDYIKYDNEKAKLENQNKNELIDKINNENSELKTCINEILSEHTNRINFITSVLVKTNADHATLELIQASMENKKLVIN